MQKLIVDSGIVIKWFITEEFEADALRILQALDEDKISLLAPDLLFSEVGNVIWKKVQFDNLDSSRAQQVIDAIRKSEILVVSGKELLNDAYDLAVTHKRTVYDAMYLALSVREDCPFVTADKKLYNAVHAAIPNMTWVADWKL